MGRSYNRSNPVRRCVLSLRVSYLQGHWTAGNNFLWTTWRMKTSKEEVYTTTSGKQYCNALEFVKQYIPTFIKVGSFTADSCKNMYQYTTAFSCSSYKGMVPRGNFATFYILRNLRINNGVSLLARERGVSHFQTSVVIGWKGKQLQSKWWQDDQNIE